MLWRDVAPVRPGCGYLADAAPGQARLPSALRGSWWGLFLLCSNLGARSLKLGEHYFQNTVFVFDLV